jgi:hypothetical protein
MKSELDPRKLASRLEVLRSAYVAETVEEAHGRLARERPRDIAPFDVRVARRLAELRALCELARELHRDR